MNAVAATCSLLFTELPRHQDMFSAKTTHDVMAEIVTFRPQPSCPLHEAAPFYAQKSGRSEAIGKPAQVTPGISKTTWRRCRSRSTSSELSPAQRREEIKRVAGRSYSAANRHHQHGVGGVGSMAGKWIADL